MSEVFFIATVSGGGHNQALGSGSTIGGGIANIASGENTAIVGGYGLQHFGQWQRRIFGQ